MMASAAVSSASSVDCCTVGAADIACAWTRVGREANTADVIASLVSCMHAWALVGWLVGACAAVLHYAYTVAPCRCVRAANAGWLVGAAKSNERTKCIGVPVLCRPSVCVYPVLAPLRRAINRWIAVNKLRRAHIYQSLNLDGLPDGLIRSGSVERRVR